MKLIEFPKKEDGPDKDLVALAEKMLERAKAGEITDFVTVGLDDEGDPFIVIATDYIDAHGLLVMALKAL